MKSGILTLNKPAGMTSFDCIRALKKSLGRTDLGHGGTLDKFATGVLPVLVGEGLKLVRFFLENYPELPTYWKTYSGTFEFGRSTTTADPEGETLEERPLAPGLLTVERIQSAMDTFVNAIYEQMPPRYSAKKVGGERASDLARAGKTADLKPVRVTVRKLECIGVDGKLVHFRAECSKGTYIRTLAEDLATKLETVAHVANLQRDAVGPFELSNAVSLDTVETQKESAILDLRAAVSFLPPFELLPNELDQLRVGKTDGLTVRLANSGQKPNVYCAMTTLGNELRPAALLELTAEKHGVFLRAFKL